MDIPALQLSSGQLLWALNRGRPPSPRLRNELRYLRQLGVPHAEDAVGEGRGNRLRYGYEELIEVGVAMDAIRRGMKPREAAQLLIRERPTFRTLFRQALEEQPEAALTSDWVKSRGKFIPMLSQDLQLRLHDRYTATPGTFQIIKADGDTAPADLFGMSEVFADGEQRVLIPLTRLALELLAWALEVPAIRPGRAARG